MISIIIPTLNCASALKKCLRSIKKQNYHDYEIIIADGGSTDSTLSIAKKYHCRLVINKLKTAEAGKAVALFQARGDLIALIDSDNILPNHHWLSDMIKPFSNPKIIGSEPISFIYRRRAGFIERYSALIGANDPYAYFNGNYDRYSYLSGKWTNLNIKTQENSDYLTLYFKNNQNLPTMGANGTIFRKKFLLKYFHGQYLFDIDILSLAHKPLYFAKVKTGIIHTYCESSINKFIRKQRRRLTDYYYYRSQRHYQWQNSNKIIPFTLYSLLFLPALFDSVRGYFKKPDPAWFFHPLACFLTWWIYALVTVKKRFGLLKNINRLQWHQ